MKLIESNSLPQEDKTPQIDDPIEALTAEEIKFSRLVAQGYALTTAYRKSHPAKSKLTYGRIRQLASDLMTKTNVVTEVATTRERQSRMARLAEDRLEDILVNDSTGFKGSKVADVAMFIYDHTNGRATQRIDMNSTSVNLSIDMTAQPE